MEEDLTKIEHFCVMPFLGAQYMAHNDSYTASISPCCFYKGELETKFYSSPNKESLIFKKLQDSFLNGEMPEGCSTCWTREEHSSRSLRTDTNTVFAKEIMTKTVLNRNLKFLEHKASNVCNLSCRMCGQFSSSKWYEINKKLSTPENWEIINSPIKFEYSKWSNIDLENITYLKLMGGEPLYQKESLELLRYIQKTGRIHEITIFLITNCTIKLSEELKDILQQAQGVVVTLSIDAFGSLNDYIRSDSDWNYVKEVLDDYILFRNENKNIVLNVNTTVIVYNINMLTPLVDFCNKNMILYSFYLTDRPKFLDARLLSYNSRMKFANTLPIVLAEQLLQNIYTKTDRIKHLIDLRKFTTLLDTYHKKYLKDYNLEIYKEIYNDD